MKHMGLSFALINWIWLQTIDTPIRWFPTKYNHSFGSLGTLILSHCQLGSSSLNSMLGGGLDPSVPIPCFKRCWNRLVKLTCGHWFWSFFEAPIAYYIYIYIINHGFRSRSCTMFNGHKSAWMLNISEHATHSFLDSSLHNAIKVHPALQSSVIPPWNYAPQLPGKSPQLLRRKSSTKMNKYKKTI